MLPCHVPSLRHPSKWMFAPLLLFLAELGSDAQPTYQWKDAVTNEKLTCQQCPPGTFVAQHCTRDRQTVCKPCPDLHYTQYWNYLEKCRYCNVICEEKQVEVQQCNSTHNRVCQCQEGYYSEMEFCVRHSECPPGSGVEKLGTPFENTQCRACPRGFFSSSSSSTKPCQPHQDCEKQGKVTNVQGNQYHDTLCTSCRLGRSNSTQGPATQQGGRSPQQRARGALAFPSSPATANAAFLLTKPDSRHELLARSTTGERRWKALSSVGRGPGEGGRSGESSVSSTCVRQRHPRPARLFSYL